MKHSIQNKFLRVEIKEKGAELCSIKSVSTNQEFIWQADSEIWASHAPNLFPVIGCLKQNGFVYNGKEYPMTKHGFVRNSKNIVLYTKTENSLCFLLKSNEYTRSLYPFEFELYIHFILDANKLIVKHEVCNTGNNEMLFCLGGHPAFNCPVYQGENYSDYYLEFEKKETACTWNIDENGLIEGEGTLVLNDSKHIDLHKDIFSNDALILKNLTSSFVQLKSRVSSFSAKFDLSDFPFLGLWAKPNAPFICIEPWIGIADSSNTNREFSTKEIIKYLEPLCKFSASYSIEINE